MAGGFVLPLPPDVFDHVGIVIADLEVSRRFYVECLAPLDVGLLEDHAEPGAGGWLVFGRGDDDPFFVVAGGRPSFWAEEHAAAQSPVHIAFITDSRKSVEGFHRTGLAAGGRDNGEPRERRTYSAFLIDPDGNNVEALCPR